MATANKILKGIGKKMQGEWRKREIFKRGGKKYIKEYKKRLNLNNKLKEFLSIIANIDLLSI